MSVILGGQTCVITNKGIGYIRDFLGDISISGGNRWARCLVEPYENDDVEIYRFYTSRGTWLDIDKNFSFLGLYRALSTGLHLTNGIETSRFFNTPYSPLSPELNVIEEDLSKKSFLEFSIEGMKEVSRQHPNEIYYYMCHYLFDKGYLITKKPRWLHLYIPFYCRETALFFSQLCMSINFCLSLDGWNIDKLLKVIEDDCLGKEPPKSRPIIFGLMILRPLWAYNSTSSFYHNLLTSSTVFTLVPYNEFVNDRDMLRKPARKFKHLASRLSYVRYYDHFVNYEKVFYKVDKYRVTPLDDSSFLMISRVPVFAQWKS